MRSRLFPVVGSVVLLVIVVLAAAAGGSWVVEPSSFSARPAPVELTWAPRPAPSLQATPPQDGDGGMPWVLLALVALAVVLLLLGATTLVRRVHAWRGEEKQTPVDADSLGGGLDATGLAIDLPVLVDAVAVALHRLDAAATPSDAVVAAWVSLEEAAAAHGWERHPAETSTEFTARLLDVSPAPPAHAATLRRLYQQARFTMHPVTATHVAEARTALEAIARALEGRPA